LGIRRSSGYLLKLLKTVGKPSKITENSQHFKSLYINKETMDKEQFYNNIVTELENGNLVLPTLPEVALKVRDAVDDPDATAAGLAEVITTDAALSARLLKVANSPLYRGRVAIDSVQMAVSRLGLGMVRNLVTSLVMEQIFRPNSKAVEKRLKKLWEHSTEIAAASRVIASKFRHINSEEAMLGGLIHNIGILPILAKAESEPELLNDESTLDDIIEKLYPQIGAAILRSWEFSDELIAVVSEHNNLNRHSAEIDLVDIVQVAVQQSYINTSKAPEPGELAKIPAFEKLGIEPDVSVVELDENSEEYAEALAMFNFD
jgi:HD-like signal output (HDOD) protein